MWQNFWGQSWQMPMMGSWGGWQAGWPLMLLVVAWSLFWKGTALWKAARSGSKEWFVAILVVNTLGILEILYLYVFSGKKSSPVNN